MTRCTDSPDFRRLALAAASQAATALAAVMLAATEGPLRDREAFGDDEAIEKLADALKLSIEATITAGEPLDEMRGQLLGALVRYLEDHHG